MLSSYIDLPHCLRVAVLLINRDGRAWMGKRRRHCAVSDAGARWQMPGGTIDRSEPAHEAALRALEDETGIRKARLLAEAPGWFSYELPGDLLGIALDGRYCGQKQKWVALRFLGDDGEIALSASGAYGTFEKAMWMSAADVPRLAAPLERQLYEDVVATFAPFLDMSAARAVGVGEDMAAPAMPWFVAPPR